MADTAVAITAGTGTNIDTRTEATNGNHRQVIVVGDPSTNAGVAPVDATTGLVVNIGPGVDLGSGTGGSKTPRVLIDTSQIDSIAHDSVDSGPPQKTGGRAVAGLSGITLVAAADRTDSLHGIDGAQYVRPHCGLEDIVSGVLANTDGASTAVIAAQGAGVKVYVTTAIIANTSATAVTVDLRDGAAGSVKATLPVPANTSGVICNLPVPLPFSANTAVCMDGSAAASTVTCTLIGFKSKV